MATAKKINVESYCDGMYTKLEGVKDHIVAMRKDVAKTFGKESELFRSHDRHLLDIAEYVDWKLQILVKACPFEWHGADKGIEPRASVKSPEKQKGPEFSGGYIGG